MPRGSRCSIPGSRSRRPPTRPRLPEGGGEVTYTYRVRNTGDVPLAGVAERIADDTCSPVEYVSGDTDGDGLLDTPNSIFEDAANETWIFTCTTNLDETTTNVVTVPARRPTRAGCRCAGPSRDAAATWCGAGDRAVRRGGQGPGDRPGPGTGAGLGRDREPPSGALPDTGSDVTWQLLVLAMSLTLLGAGLMAFSRRDLGRAQSG